MVRYLVNLTPSPQVLQRFTEVDTMFQSMDKTVADNRQLDLEFELMLMGRRDYSDMIDLDDETVAVPTERSRGGLGEAGDKKDCRDQRLSSEEWEGKGKAFRRDR